MSSLPKGVVEAVAVNSAAAIATQPSVLANQALSNIIASMNLANQNAVAHQQMMNQLQTAMVAKLISNIAAGAPPKAAAPPAVSFSAEEVARLRALLAALGQK